jgi:glutamate-5-semialdehyde dehydrogenase
MDMGEKIDLDRMGQMAREATRKLARATTEQKNGALYTIADALDANTERILVANRLDLEEGRANGLNESLLDRLSLQGRLAAIAQDVRQVAKLPDPVGEIFDETTMPNGLQVSKRRTPIGVLGLIYEARPNVTVDVAVLAIKTGNCGILRGGSEMFRSSTILVEIIRETLEGCGLPANSIQLIPSTDRKYVLDLLQLHRFVDLIIPRGGASLHEFCREHAKMPVLTGGIGVVHIFVDESADLDAALDIVENAKVQRPSVCNALDTLLVHENVATKFIPRVIERLSTRGVTFRLDSGAMQTLTRTDDNRIAAAGPDEWDTEWLSLVLGIKTVVGLDEAIEHIHAHSTGHTESILTRNEANAARFLDEVDSAAVMVNASTRFNDGGQLGLGAEAAISTQRLHARGPVGLHELCSYKWVVVGDNHVRP